MKPILGHFIDVLSNLKIILLMIEWKIWLFFFYYDAEVERPILSLLIRYCFWSWIVHTFDHW